MIPKKFFMVFGSICVVVSMILGMTIPANAQPGNIGERNPLQTIAEIYSKHYGVTMDEALFRLKLQDSFPGLNTALENDEKLTFSGLWIQHQPEYKIVVAFTSDAETTINKYGQYITDDVKPYIETRTVKKSLTELGDEQQKLTASLNELGIKGESRIDIINNCVSVDIVKTDEGKFNNAKQNNILLLPEGLKVNIVDAMPMLTSEIYGGLPLWVPIEPPYANIGTSGFSVRNAAGTIKGIATAAHISKPPNYMLMYYGNYLLGGGAMINGGAYDVQWRTCPGLTVTNKIQWWSDGSTFTVNAKKPRSEQHIGDIVSKYGRTTHYTAGQISSTTYDGTWIEVSNVFGYTKVMDGGDSGGPWFTGNGSGVVALGISHAVSEDFQRAYYMAEDYIESGLSMYVMTSP